MTSNAERHAQEALDKLKTSDPDSQFASRIADLLIAKSPILPIILLINHDVGAPDYKACPLPYECRRGRYVWISFDIRAQAYDWIVDALQHGYTVMRPKDKTFYAGFAMKSLQAEKHRAAYREQRDPLSIDEDTIPF